MRVRLPLYGKILLWFFLNLVAVAAVVLILFNVQFNFNLDWLLVTGARERLEAVRDLIVGELAITQPDEWEEVLRRYSEAHRVHFALFDDQARPLIGGIAELPAEVRARILARPNFGRTNRPGEENAATVAAPPERSGEQFRRWWPRSLRAIMRTSDPTQYWLLATGWLDNAMFGPPMRVVLVARSNTISAGGLIFDPKPWLVMILGLIVFSLLFWFPLVHGMTRALGRMTQATRRIADGRFDVRLKVRRRDELGSLGESIDQMAERLDGLVTGQKRFLGDIAHELCSPLARLQMSLGILEQHATDGEAKLVRAATEKAEQIAGLVGEILSFSKASFGASALQLRPVNVRVCAEEAVRRETVEGTDLRVEIASDFFVAADSELLVRALSNLLRNACRHAAAAGPIVIRASSEGEEVAITVSDCGPGVPEEELPKIFDAFYRVDTSRTRDTGGSGLGLAIVKTCIDSCCGTVSARNRQHRGLEVIIRLHAEKAPLEKAV
jgi:two-component system sensor histidine kinase CpxA